jgi:hypothetical protein
VASRAGIAATLCACSAPFRRTVAAGLGWNEYPVVVTGPAGDGQGNDRDSKRNEELGGRPHSTLLSEKGRVGLIPPAAKFKDRVRNSCETAVASESL